MPVRRRMRLNKTTASAHPIIGDQYCQTAGTPYWRTSAQTHKGVSAAKLVATMDEPAIYHFKVRPECVAGFMQEKLGEAYVSNRLGKVSRERMMASDGL
jgi:hypothetical protein